jgi:hypothetical protein
MRYRDDCLGGIETTSIIDLEMLTSGHDRAHATVMLSWSNVMSNALQLNFDKATIINGFNTASSLELVYLRHQYTDIRHTLQKERIEL